MYFVKLELSLWATLHSAVAQSSLVLDPVLSEEPGQLDKLLLVQLTVSVLVGEGQKLLQQLIVHVLDLLELIGEDVFQLVLGEVGSIRAVTEEDGSGV